MYIFDDDKLQLHTKGLNIGSRNSPKEYQCQHSGCEVA